MNDASSTFAAASVEMADGFARICRLYGVSPLVGRLWAALYLSTRPLSLDELCERVGAAKSSVSVALKRVTAARIARRLPPRVDRRDYYEAVTDPWVILSEWTKLFFRPEPEMFEQTGAAVRRALAAADAPPPAERGVLSARLDAFDAFARALSSVLMGLSPQARAAAPESRQIPITVEGSP